MVPSRRHAVPELSAASVAPAAVVDDTFLEEHEAETVPTPTSVLDGAAVAGLVATAPAFVVVQYEVLDLRHEVEALKQELAALRTKAAEQSAEVKTSKLSIVDASGKVTAGISSDGVVSCRLIELRAAPPQ